MKGKKSLLLDFRETSLYQCLMHSTKINKTALDILPDLPTPFPKSLHLICLKGPQTKDHNRGGGEVELHNTVHKGLNVDISHSP